MIFVDTNRPKRAPISFTRSHACMRRDIARLHPPHSNFACGSQLPTAEKSYNRRLQRNITSIERISLPTIFGLPYIETVRAFIHMFVTSYALSYFLSNSLNPQPFFNLESLLPTSMPNTRTTCLDLH